LRDTEIEQVVTHRRYGQRARHGEGRPFGSALLPVRSIGPPDSADPGTTTPMVLRQPECCCGLCSVAWLDGRLHVVGRDRSFGARPVTA